MISSLLLISNVHASDAPKHSGDLLILNAEIMTIESLRDPLGAAVYTVRDLKDGSVSKLYADPHVTLVQVGGKTMEAADVPYGSRAKILYWESRDKTQMPRMSFVKARSSF